MTISLNPADPLFSSPSPDVLEKRISAGPLRIIGLPFFLAGLFVFQIPFGLIPVSNQDEIKGWMLLFLPLFSLPFIAIGGGLLFGAKTLVMDKTRNTVTQAWTLFSVPVRRKEFPLNSFYAITVTKHVGDRNSPTTYPVALANQDRVPILNLLSPVKYEESRQISEQVAKFLGLPIEDSSSGEKVLREPDRLDETIAQAARRTREKVDLPPAPPMVRSKIEQLGRQLIIDIPGPAFGPASLVGGVVPLVIAVFIISYFLDQRGPFFEEYRVPVITVVALLAVVLGLRSALRRRGSTIRVTASPEELRVESRAGGRNRVQAIPGAELEELHMVKAPDLFGPQFKKLTGPAAAYSGPPTMPDGRPAPRWMLMLASLARSPGIIARSDKATVQFGAGLPEDELEYLCALIKKAVVE